MWRRRQRRQPHHAHRLRAGHRRPAGQYDASSASAHSHGLISTSWPLRGGRPLSLVPQIRRRSQRPEAGGVPSSSSRRAGSRPHHRQRRVPPRVRGRPGIASGPACARAAQGGVEPTGLSTYTFQLVPALWLLTQRTRHRVFQHLSAPEIVEKLLRRWRIRPRLSLSQRHPKLAMRTQYGESDFDFVRRLLAEAGISFSFHTDDGEPTHVVLSDAPETAEPLPGGPTRFAADSGMARGMPHVSDIAVSSRVVATRATPRDHDFRRPRHVTAHAAPGSADGSLHALLEDYRYAPGHSLAHASAAAGRTHGQQPLSVPPPGPARRRPRHAWRRSRDDIAFTRHDLVPGAIFSVGAPTPGITPRHACRQRPAPRIFMAGAIPAGPALQPPVDDDAGLPVIRPLSTAAKPHLRRRAAARRDPAPFERRLVTMRIPWIAGKLDEERLAVDAREQAWKGPRRRCARSAADYRVAFPAAMITRSWSGVHTAPKSRTRCRSTAISIHAGADTAWKPGLDHRRRKISAALQAAEDLPQVARQLDFQPAATRPHHLEGRLTSESFPWLRPSRTKKPPAEALQPPPAPAVTPRWRRSGHDRGVSMPERWRTTSSLSPTIRHGVRFSALADYRRRGRSLRGFQLRRRVDHRGALRTYVFSTTTEDNTVLLPAGQQLTCSASVCRVARMVLAIASAEKTVTSSSSWNQVRSLMASVPTTVSHEDALDLGAIASLTSFRCATAIRWTGVCSHAAQTPSNRAESRRTPAGGPRVTAHAENRTPHLPASRCRRSSRGDSQCTLRLSQRAGSPCARSTARRCDSSVACWPDSRHLVAPHRRGLQVVCPARAQLRLGSPRHGAGYRAADVDISSASIASRSPRDRDPPPARLRASTRRLDWRTTAAARLQPRASAPWPSSTATTRQVAAACRRLAQADQTQVAFSTTR